MWELFVCQGSAGLANLFAEDAIRGSLPAPVVAPVVVWLASEGRWSDARIAAARANAVLRGGAPSREVVAVQVATEALLAARDPTTFPGHWQTDLHRAVASCAPAGDGAWVRDGQRWVPEGGTGPSACVEAALRGAPASVGRVVVRVGAWPE